VIDTQNFIEDALQLKELHIQQSIPYATIYRSLEQQCDATSIQEATTLAETLKRTRANDFRSQPLLKKEMERRFTILKNMIPHLTTKEEHLFCKQKYLTYSLLEYTQALYGGQVKATPLSEKNPTSLLPIVQTPVEQIGEPLLHTSAETSENVHYLTLTNNNQFLSNQTDITISQLSEYYIQKEIGKLISLRFLTPNDLELLHKNIELNYVPECGTTR
jgi:hypothetical protein